MAGKQLIVVDAKGNLSTIRRKRDAGLDLRDVGGALSVRRVSDIVWSETLQGFTINLLPTDGERHRLTVNKLHEVGMSYSEVCKTLQSEDGGKVRSANGVLYFDDYEDAVTIEVQYLEKSKAQGDSSIW